MECATECWKFLLQRVIDDQRAMQNWLGIQWLVRHTRTFERGRIHWADAQCRTVRVEQRVDDGGRVIAGSYFFVGVDPIDGVELRVAVDQRLRLRL